MRVLIFGGGGMLGHRVYEACRERFETWVTLHDDVHAYPAGLFDRGRTLARLDVRVHDGLVAALAQVRPDSIVNCVGIIKQRHDAEDPILALTVNALFPHRLAAAAEAWGARVIHISTDCVFSGRTGGYREDDAPDAGDLYGRTKLLGEIGPPHLTLRTSLIGREVRGSTGLVEWFLAQRGRRAAGYRGAIFSGLTTDRAAALVANLIEHHRSLCGTYHVAAAPITKFDLLEQLNAALGAGVTIEPADDPAIDRSLDGSRFAAATGYAAPSWPDMVAGLAADADRYNDWRRCDI
jgi:dTDP-4-dehydrorhamnose reductase